MKKIILFIVFALMISVTTNAQRGQRGNQETMAKVNGCNDGSLTAYRPNWEDTLNSIMFNWSISDVYKVAYYEAFMKCRRNRLRGNKVKSYKCTYYDGKSKSYVNKCGDRDVHIPYNDDKEQEK